MTARGYSGALKSYLKNRFQSFDGHNNGRLQRSAIYNFFLLIVGFSGHFPAKKFPPIAKHLLSLHFMTVGFILRLLHEEFVESGLVMWGASIYDRRDF